MDLPRLLERIAEKYAETLCNLLSIEGEAAVRFHAADSAAAALEAAHVGGAVSEQELQRLAQVAA